MDMGDLAQTAVRRTGDGFVGVVDVGQVAQPPRLAQVQRMAVQRRAFARGHVVGVGREQLMTGQGGVDQAPQAVVQAQGFAFTGDAQLALLQGVDQFVERLLETADALAFQLGAIGLALSRAGGSNQRQLYINCTGNSRYG